MSKSKIFICILTVLLVSALLLISSLETDHPFVTACFPVDGGVEEVKPWYDDYTGIVYLFLPGSVKLENVTLDVGRNEEYFFGGILVKDGMDCSSFRMNERYAVEGPMYSGENIMFVSGSGIPAMFVDVDSGSMHYLHQDKNHTEHGQLRLYDSLGQSLYQGELYSVKGRGQSSWQEEKKSYNIRLRRSADLLGMGSAENWVLQSNSKDPSGIRNKMIFDFAESAGLAFAPDSQWVDMYLNGEYAGLYLLCERIEVHPERIAIPQDGSFLVGKDAEWRFEEDKAPYIMTEGKTALEIKYSDYDSQTLQRMWQSVENAIMADNGVDPVSGKHWTEWIDVDSWVKKYLVEEVFGNMDGQTLSQYYYLDGSRDDGRISAGPVWDYDLAVLGAYNAYHISRPGVYGSHWQPALFAKEEFYSQLRQTYASVFRPLLQNLMDGEIDGYFRYIRDSKAADAMRWFNRDSEEELQMMKQYLQERTALLDRIWTEEEAHIRITMIDYQGTVAVRIQEPGSLLPELENVGGYAWFYTTGEAVDQSSRVFEDITVRQKEVIPEAVPEVVPEIVPEVVPEVVPETVPEIIPEVIPDAVPEEPVPETSDQEELAQELQPDEILPPQRFAPLAIFVAVMAAVVAVDFKRRRIRKTENEKIRLD